MIFNQIKTSIDLRFGYRCKTPGLDQYGSRQLHLWDAKDGYQALRLQAKAVYSVRSGQVIAEMEQKKTKALLHIPNAH